VALAFRLEAVAVSGVDVELVTKAVQGVGPLYLTLKNTGDEVIDVDVLGLPYEGGPGVLHASVLNFDPDDVVGLDLPHPIEVLQLRGTADSGPSTLEVVVTTPLVG
jgi:hypothetical protein